MLSEYTYSFVQKKMQDLMCKASYIVVTCDKSIDVANTSWLCHHAYMMLNWAKKSFLLTLQKFDSDGYIANTLLTINISILSHHEKIEAN